MTTCHEVLPARKSSKHSAIAWTPAEVADTPASGVLVIDTDRNRASYAVSEFPTDWAGRGFHLVKLTEGTDTTAESYSVFCGDNDAKLCECRGFERFRHCKHADALQALIANRWI